MFEVYREEQEAEHRVYHLQAESEKERSEWMTAIKNNILYELNRTRALVDEVDKYKERIAQLTDELERQKAKQILADINKPRTDSQPTTHTTTAPQPTAQPPPSWTAAAVAQQQQQHVRSPSSVELYDRVSYLEAENARLMAENQSLKRSTLAMQGKGDEIRPTAETTTDEAAAAQHQPTPPPQAATEQSNASAGAAAGEAEVDRLIKELVRVRMERSILKREVLRLMKVNEELTHAPSAAIASPPPPQPGSAIQ